MALPINSTTPVYTITLPSTEKPIKYRPFLIKEEKSLLIAQQSEDPMVMVNTLKEVIKSCIKDEIDVDSLATFDLEYIFTQLRAKSVGEIVDLQLKCDTCTDEKSIAMVKVDLTKLEVKKSPEHNSKINLFDDVGIVMKYPTIEIIKKLENSNINDIEEIFDIVTQCVDYIHTTDEVFYAKEQTKEELVEFLNNLSSEQFMKVQKFFETMPKLTKEIKYNCPVCGKEHNKVLEGLSSFF
jgi:ribosomal protein L44E